MPPSEPPLNTWPPLQRWLFRFVAAYLVLYNLPFPLNCVTGGFAPYDNAWDALTIWVGRHFFHRVVDVTDTGSGDTTAGWVQVFCCLVLALLVTIVWSLPDRKRPHYSRLADGMRVYARFALAWAMISYGAVKVIPSQFPPPSLDRLLEPIGNASPMGLLWTFMGASPAYNVFAGLIEMAGGLLLTTRHTTLLGALLCLGALSNVVALNFCYDVPVKQYSFHLLLMAAFLAAPDVRRLLDFFIRGRATPPTPLRPLFTSRRLNIAARVARTLFVAFGVGMSLWQSYQSRQEDQSAAQTPLYGLWTVDEWDSNAVKQLPLVTDTSQWHRVVFDYPGTMAVLTLPGDRQRFRLTLNPAAKTLALKRRDDPAWSATLTYAQPRSDLLTLSGPLDGHPVTIHLHHEDPRHFLLLSRGFHWVNEFPLNR